MRQKHNITLPGFFHNVVALVAPYQPNADLFRLRCHHADSIVWPEYRLVADHQSIVGTPTKQCCAIRMKHEKKIDTDNIRIDTTVDETNIHYPTDSSLLCATYRVKTLAKAKQIKAACLKTSINVDVMALGFALKSYFPAMAKVVDAM